MVESKLQPRSLSHHAPVHHLDLPLHVPIVMCGDRLGIDLLYPKSHANKSVARCLLKSDDVPFSHGLALSPNITG